MYLYTLHSSSISASFRPKGRPGYKSRDLCVVLSCGGNDVIVAGGGKLRHKASLGGYVRYYWNKGLVF